MPGSKEYSRGRTNVFESGSLYLTQEIISSQLEGVGGGRTLLYGKNPLHTDLYTNTGAPPPPTPGCQVVFILQ
jgi:hypothetical protein